MIVGLAGPKRSGKDSVAGILALNYGFTCIAYALPIKAALMSLFGWTQDHVNGPYKDAIDPNWGISPRQAMQSLGDWGRDTLPQTFPEFSSTTGSGLYVDRLKRIIEGNPDVENWVVTDIRFDDEAEAVIELGGTIVEVIRPDIVKDDPHKSEAGVSPIYISFSIYNGEEIEDLNQEVHNLYRRLLHA